MHKIYKVSVLDLQEFIMEGLQVMYYFKMAMRLMDLQYHHVCQYVHRSTPRVDLRHVDALGREVVVPGIKRLA